MKQERINEISGVFFLLLGLFTLFSLFGHNSHDISFYTSHPNSPVKNITGIIGAYTSFGLYLSFGWSAFVVPILFLIWAASFITQRVPDKRFLKFVGLFTAIAASATLFAVLASEENRIAAGNARHRPVGMERQQDFARRTDQSFADHFDADTTHFRRSTDHTAGCIPENTAISTINKYGAGLCAIKGSACTGRAGIRCCRMSKLSFR